MIRNKLHSQSDSLFIIYLFNFQERRSTQIYSCRQVEVPGGSAPEERLAVPPSVVLAMWALLFNGQKCPRLPGLHVTRPYANRTHGKQLHQAALIHYVFFCPVGWSGRVISIRKGENTLQYNSQPNLSAVYLAVSRALPMFCNLTHESDAVNPFFQFLNNHVSKDRNTHSRRRYTALLTM